MIFFQQPPVKGIECTQSYCHTIKHRLEVIREKIVCDCALELALGHECEYDSKIGCIQFF